MAESLSRIEALLQEGDWLRRLCRGLTHGIADAEDLAQDVLGEPRFGKPPEAHASGAPIRGWLATVARRRAVRLQDL